MRSVGPFHSALEKRTSAGPHSAAPSAESPAAVTSAAKTSPVGWKVRACRSPLVRAKRGLTSQPSAAPASSAGFDSKGFMVGGCAPRAG